MKVDLTNEEHTALLRLVKHALGLFLKTTVSDRQKRLVSGSGITQRRYGGDRNRAKVAEDERRWSIPRTPALYLASGGVNLDRSRVGVAEDQENQARLHLAGVS